MIRVDLNIVDREVITRATEVVREGGVVLYPTDTIYGLGCDPYHEGALDRLFEIKKRDLEKGVLILIPSLDWVDRVTLRKPDWFPDFASKFWPGAVTVLLEADPSLPSRLVGAGRKLGLRLPKPEFLQAWLKAMDKPLVSTSANLSGQPPPENFAELEKVFSNRVDLVLEGPEPNQGAPSTVVDLSGPSPEVVRVGTEGNEVRAYLEER